jgi:hypothetical protein
MTETEIKKLKKAVLERWELAAGNNIMGMIEVLNNQRPKLKVELAEKKYSSFDLSPSILSINIIKDEAWLAFIEAYNEKDQNICSTAESEEAAHNALDKYLEELKNVDFKEDTQDEKTEKIDREAGLAELEKINWRGTETQLVLLVDLLTREALLKSDRKWKMIEEHFLVQGKPTKSKNLSQSLENTLAGKTKDEETLKKIVSEVKKLED